MPATRHFRRGLHILGVVAPVFLGLAGVASAQESTLVSTAIVLAGPGLTVITEPGSPLPTGDLTGEGALIGLPSGPVLIESAPATSAPQIEVAAPPPSTLRASDIPDRATILDDVFGILDCESDPICVVRP